MSRSRLRFDGEIRGGAIAFIVLVVALVWMHPEVALHGQVYASSDAQAAAAFRMAGDRALQAGEYPYWNPFVFAGMPSYASLAYNPGVYPLTAPLRLLRDALGLPPMTWLLFHLLWMGAGMTGYLRWRGNSWAAAIGGGVLLMSLPKILAWSAYGHGTKVGTFAWMPWAMWAAEAFLRRGNLRWLSALAIALAMQLLRAHVQIVYYTVLAIGVWGIAHLVAEWRASVAWRRSLPRVAWLAVAGVLALGVAATLYLPVMEYQSWSIRGGAGAAGAAAAGSAYDYATSWSMKWSEIATLWWPTVVGYGRASYVGGMPFTDYPHYLGLPLLLLALGGLLLRRDRWSWAAVALIVVSTLLALGKYGPLYRMAYELLPGFQKFRVPVMILCLQHFAWILLAARGLDLVAARVREGERPKWLGMPLAVALTVIGVLLLAVSTIGAGSWQSWLMGHWSEAARAAGRATPPATALRETAEIATGDALRMGAILLATVGIFFALARRRITTSIAVSLVVGLLFLDVWRVDQPLLHPEQHLYRLARQGQRLVALESEPMIQAPKVLEEYTASSPLSDWLLDQSPRPRVWPIVGPRATDNVLAARGIVSLGGYHAAKLKVYEDLRQRLFASGRPDVKLANLLGARFVLSPQVFSAATMETLDRMGLRLERTPVWQGDEGVVYRSESALPRAWLVHEVEFEDPSRSTTARLPAPEVLDRVVASGFDPTRRAILSESVTASPPSPDVAETVTIAEESDHHLVYHVKAASSGAVVMSEIFYPEWKARVDGEPARLLRADHALRAVAVPAGDHVLELRYDAGSHRHGLWIRWVSLLLILVGLVLPQPAPTKDEPDEGAVGT